MLLKLVPLFSVSNSYGPARLVRALFSLSRVFFFALTSIRERPLLYDIRGGSLKLLLSYACCFIKCKLFMSTGFKFCTAG